MIELDRDGDVRILRLHDGENRFNRGAVDAIHDALDQVEATVGPVALVTVGDGKFFSNGLDLDWMGAEGADDPAFLDDVHRMLQRTLMIDVITVAAINGHAFAAGAMFATAHDHRLMRQDRGYWCLPEVDLGLPLTPEMFSVLDAHLPRTALADAALSGNRYDAVTAAAMGLITAAVPAEQLLEDAVALAARHAGKDRRVIAAHKQLLHGPLVARL
jgi:Delta3-Delta2-enoyl-CoA isomerase